MAFWSGRKGDHRGDHDHCVEPCSSAAGGIIGDFYAYYLDALGKASPECRTPDTAASTDTPVHTR